MQYQGSSYVLYFSAMGICWNSSYSMVHMWMWKHICAGQVWTNRTVKREQSIEEMLQGAQPLLALAHDILVVLYVGAGGGPENMTPFNHSLEKLQCTVYMQDQVDILEFMVQQGEGHWLPWRQEWSLLYFACECGAWNWVKYLISEHSGEIN